MSDHFVDQLDRSKVERVAKKNMRKGIKLFDTNLRMLAPQDCFEAATANCSNTIFLVPETSMNTMTEFAATASDSTTSRQGLGPKRVAVDEISERHHVRKKQIL